jgi:hypothetical protein
VSQRSAVNSTRNIEQGMVYYFLTGMHYRPLVQGFISLNQMVTHNTGVGDDTAIEF